MDPDTMRVNRTENLNFNSSQVSNNDRNFNHSTVSRNMSMV